MQVPKSPVLEPLGTNIERTDGELTATFVVKCAVHRSNGEGQESDELELHGDCDEWDGGVEGGDAMLLWS